MKKRLLILNLMRIFLRTTLGIVAFIGVSTLFLVTAHGDSAVNNYIYQNNLQPANVTKSIWSGFPTNKYTTGKPDGVVVHETGNPNSTIYGEIAYMKKNYQNAFVHSYVDVSRVINIANTDYLAWGCGFPGNGRFLQFEQVEVHSKSAFAKEVNNAANYTAELLHQYNLPLNNAVNDGKGTVWSHKAVAHYLGGSDHVDPDGYYAKSGQTYFGQAYTMNDFYALVKHYYGADNSSTSGSSDSQSSSGLNANSITQPATVKYNRGQGNETAVLNQSFAKYRLYNHVKGSGYSTFSYSWAYTPAYTGRKVYVDSRAIKKPSKSTWYRIRFSKAFNAQKYWVYSKALNFNPVTFADTKNEITIRKGQYALRNHVYNTATLSQITGYSKDVLNKTVRADKKAVKSYPNGSTVWYRFKLNKQNIWVCEQALK
ncbi:MAG: N-acetylmuramoyl-L-alanine amidase [Lentilactobacillus sunkii]|uniref:peptidoglycan recognition protein family protein n=1 Tax=Lentilactobacillus sunkii TaxID=481719 RepID=UPI0009F32EBF